MKNKLSLKSLVCAALLATVTCVGAQTNQGYTVKFTPSPQVYTGPTNVTIDVGTYFFYLSTNVTLPLSQWAFFGSTQASYSVPSSSNYFAVTNFSNFIVMNPPVYCSAVISNSGGVSPFSNLGGYLGQMSGGRLTALTSP